MSIYLDHITIVNSQGKARSNRQTSSELNFDCEVRSLGKLKERKQCFVSLRLSLFTRQCTCIS
jgi:hypothetical protein